MQPYVQDADFTLYQGDVLDVLRKLPFDSVDCCVTSPPYENSRREYPPFKGWCELFSLLRHRCCGPALLNVGRRWQNGTELLWWLDVLDGAQEADWVLLDTLVWAKPNANPIRGEVLADSHEYVFILGPKRDTLLNVDAIRTPYADEAKARMARKWVNGTGVKGAGRGQDSRELHPLGARPRSYVTVTTGQEKGNQHPAPMPEQLAEHLVKLSSWAKQTVLDPFAGSGTTCLTARKLGRKSVGIELNPDYCALAARRLGQQSLLAEGAA